MGSATSGAVQPNDGKSAELAPMAEANGGEVWAGPAPGCFGLGCARLHVDTDATSDDLSFSALCLLGAGVAILDEIAEGQKSDALYGALYLLRQARMVLDPALAMQAGGDANGGAA